MRRVRFILIQAVLVTITQGVFAQKAPNFIITDTEGRDWNLYEELGKGKTVILDFFFVDCQPCSTWTPELIKLYTDYGTGSKDVLILGISDRDDDDYIAGFEDHFGTSYPSAGTNGGGDTVTQLYKSWFPFKGWPTYSVICADTHVVWNVDRTTDLPELRTVVDSCQRLNMQVETLGLPAEPEAVLFPNPANHTLNAFFANGWSEISELQIASALGQKMSIVRSGFDAHSIILSISHLAPGYYVLSYRDASHRTVRKPFLIQ